MGIFEWPDVRYTYQLQHQKAEFQMGALYFFPKTGYDSGTNFSRGDRDASQVHPVGHDRYELLYSLE